MKKEYDIAIIGGGPAGLSAALTAARGNRSIIIFDDDQPRNAPAFHMMNFPSREGTPPRLFKELIKKDLAKYPLVQFTNRRVESIERSGVGFLVDDIMAKKILFSHGVKDLLPDLPGMKDLFGKSIFHCPYCHGHEHLDAPMGIIGSGELVKHFKTIVSGLTSNLVIFTNGQEAPTIEGIKIHTEKIDSFIHQGGQLRAVKLANGEVIERSYLFFRPDQKLSTDLGLKLGCELTEFGLYKVNELGLTSQPGVYAAGDVTTLRQGVLLACALGQSAGAGMNMEVLQEQEA